MIKTGTSLLIALIVAGCATKPDLLKNPNLLSADEYALLQQVASMTARKCITYRYEQTNPDKKLSGDVKIYGEIVVHRLWYSDSGWYKVEMIANGAWDNVYYKRDTGALICGDVLWGKTEKSLPIVFKEANSEGEKRPSLPLPQPISQQPSLIEELRPIAVKWESYPSLIAGTISVKRQSHTGVVKLILPNKEGECIGTYDVSNPEKGVWSLTCSNNMAATGTMQAYGRNLGSSGVGIDTKGKKVEFSVGGSVLTP